MGKKSSHLPYCLYPSICPVPASSRWPWYAHAPLMYVEYLLFQAQWHTFTDHHYCRERETIVVVMSQIVPLGCLQLSRRQGYEDAGRRKVRPFKCEVGCIMYNPSMLLLLVSLRTGTAPKTFLKQAEKQGINVSHVRAMGGNSTTQATNAQL